MSLLADSFFLGGCSHSDRLMRVSVDGSAFEVHVDSIVMSVQRGRATQPRVENTVINVVVAPRDRLIEALANAG